MEQPFLLLIGLRGSGKSTIGPLAAAHRNQPFIDLDDRTAEACGLSPSECFATKGEAHWRSAELTALNAVLAGPPAVVALGGCATAPDDVSYNAIKRNLTPELQGITESGIDIDRNMAVTSNQNLRMMWGEIGRMWLFDKPSRLSPYDIIATSGQPGQ